MPSDNWWESRMSQLFDMVADQSALIKTQSSDIATIRQDNSLLRQDILYLREENQLIIAENQELRQTITTLKMELVSVQERLTTLEAKVEKVLTMLPTLAPLVQGLLIEDNSLLLEPGYRELRDEEPKELFESANELIMQASNYPAIVSGYKNPRGLASAFGKALSDFYRTVVGFDPRVVSSKFAYLEGTERPITRCAIDLFESIKV